jgi:hypothetical protein
MDEEAYNLELYELFNEPDRLIKANKGCTANAC